MDIFAWINEFFGQVNAILASVIFFDLLPGPAVFPLALVWLIAGALFFTFYLKFINFRAFGHAIQIVRGKFSHSTDPGDVSHFQALATALSATVGLGNIAGVAIAVSLGGPGATFWMILAGLLGMTTKLTECTLAVMYREQRADGKFMGGPMEYLSRGFAEKGWPKLGYGLAILFCILCIGGSIGGGNAFQVNQSLSALKGTIPFLADHPWVYGLLITLVTGIVIIGGIKRIAKTAEKIVPLMCAIYLAGALFIIFYHLSAVPSALWMIVSQAFSPEAGYGGLVGVLVMGFRRAAFSNEAGVGSAAIAHSAAKTDVPIREGFVALLEPFIDTVVICTMTALVIVLTGVYQAPEAGDLIARNQGAAITAMAFGSVVSWFPYVLSVAVVLFAFSTMISWSYYGERCWAFMFGEKYSIYYKLMFLVAAFLGSVTSAMNVLEFSDLMILAMAFPNLIGLCVLGPKVKKAIQEYKFN